tara:strand:- start:1357 stop:1842 length:486 start_codon:yes stop_codon:yes gene_type:complete
MIMVNNMKNNMNEWKIKRNEMAVNFAERMHKLELVIVQMKTEVSVWRDAIDLMEQTSEEYTKLISRVFSALSPLMGADTSSIDVGTYAINFNANIRPRLESMTEQIEEAEQFKSRLENALSEYLTVGDRYAEGFASFEEFELASQNINYVCSAVNKWAEEE